MIFTAADMTAILAATGEAVTINSTATTAKFTTMEAAVSLLDGGIITGRPACLVTPDMVTLHEIDNGAVVTARGVDYTVIDLRQRGDGFYRLELTKL